MELQTRRRRLTAYVLSVYTHVYEDDTSFRSAGLTPTGEQYGFSHSTPARTDTASIVSVSNATATSEYWEFKTGGSAFWRMYSGVMRPTADVSYDIGNVSFRVRDAFIQRIRPGAGGAIWTSGTGSPEGVATASVGSLYTRTDGGAGTTLYVKESGASNTGWIAK